MGVGRGRRRGEEKLSQKGSARKTNFFLLFCCFCFVFCCCCCCCLLWHQDWIWLSWYNRRTTKKPGAILMRIRVPGAGSLLLLLSLSVSLSLCLSVCLSVSLSLSSPTPRINFRCRLFYSVRKLPACNPMHQHPRPRKSVQLGACISHQTLCNN